MNMQDDLLLDKYLTEELSCEENYLMSERLAIEPELVCRLTLRRRLMGLFSGVEIEVRMLIEEVDSQHYERVDTARLGS